MLIRDSFLWCSLSVCMRNKSTKCGPLSRLVCPGIFVGEAKLRTKRTQNQLATMNLFAEQRVLLLLFLLLLTSSEAFWSVSGGASKSEEEEGVEKKDSNGVPKEEVPVEYGVDISFPMHHDRVSDNYAWLPHNLDENVKPPRRYKNKAVQPLGDKQAFYEDFLMGCVNKFGIRGERCRQNERERIAMSLRQPQSMQVNEPQRCESRSRPRLTQNDQLSDRTTQISDSRKSKHRRRYSSSSRNSGRRTRTKRSWSNGEPETPTRTIGKAPPTWLAWKIRVCAVVELC